MTQSRQRVQTIELKDSQAAERRSGPRLLIKANLFRHPHREMKERNMHQGVTGRIVYDEMMEGKNEGGEEQYAEGR